VESRLECARRRIELTALSGKTRRKVRSVPVATIFSL
jgi:hypothetical protein